MRERIESLRGHLTVPSRPGEGTRIRAELPLPSRGSELSGRRRRSPLAPSWA
jgi:nitrate/nitrite-specific signal transduction histidine kinase